MPSTNHLRPILAILSLLILLVHNQSTVTWTDRPDLRMGQTSIYDSVYIPLDTTSQVDLTFKTAFTASLSSGGQNARKGIVISGFQNYLHYEIKVKVTIANLYSDRMTVNVYVGATTYIKQLNVNYFVIIPAVTNGKYSSIQILSASYVSSTLSTLTTTPSTPRVQTFSTQATSFTNAAALCSAIQGIDYYNSDGVLNEVYISTKLLVNKTVQQTITVSEKGKLFELTITTIVIDNSYYPAVDPFTTLGQVLTTSIVNDAAKSGFDSLDLMNKGGLFAKDNAFYFGIKGFKFKMQQTRLFLLTISPTNVLMSASNLEAGSWEYVDISMMVMVDRVCSTAGDHYFVEAYSCITATACGAILPVSPYTNNNILVDGTNSLCRKCATVCDGCTTDIRNCAACLPGSNRVKTGTIASASDPPTCLCDVGYVEVNGAAVCQKCSDLISGCLTCSSPTFCTDCKSPTIKNPLNATDQNCICPPAPAPKTYLVTGLCLSYPGCLVANIYITGDFCMTCDSNNNFEKKLANNSICGCKTAYYNTKNPQICEDVCGDGQTPQSPANATDTQIICDDANNQSGDGCSSSCRQEFGYRCTVASVGGLSSCAQKQQIKINYLYSQKNLVGNQGVIVFALLPAQTSLAENTFQNSISMNIPGSKKIKFDAVNSLIMITVDYPSKLQSNEYEFNFTFAGLTVYSPDIYVKATLNGINAKLTTSEAPYQTNIITYVSMGVSAFALALALISSFLGQKMLGIELILPVQAAFFSMATLPTEVLSPISALWSLKYSNGYNSLQKFDLATNYMLDNRITIMQYSGQYILNYNIMFLLIALVILIIGIIALRIAWLQRQEKRIQQIQKKKEDQDKKEPKKKKNNSEKDEKQTQDQSKKDEQNNDQTLQQELEDTRQNMKNWRNFLYMIFDRFFSILIITAMMKVIFCFYIQLSNLTYTAEVYDNSLNAGFFFLTYVTIVTGLHTIIYDYKTDKLILFTCNKGKYAMFYITIFLAYIIILGAVFETMIAVYVGAVFALMPIVLIIYQVPYGLMVFDFQAIIAIICQFPFAAMIAISLMLHFQKESITESTCMMFAYAMIGSIGLSIILTIVRLIKVIDCKKVSCVQFTDRKKQNANDKNKKKSKVMRIDLEKDKDWDQEGSVRAVLIDRQKKQEDFESRQENRQQDQGETNSKQNDSKAKDKEKPAADQQDDQDIDELVKIKMKLRKDLRQKKATGKVK